MNGLLNSFDLLDFSSMKKLMLAGILSLLGANQAVACSMSPLGESVFEFTSAIQFVSQNLRLTAPAQQIKSIRQTYRAYGAVVVEVESNDEAGTCSPYVLNVSWNASCQPVITTVSGSFSCR
jgi:hypothetical protein